MSAMCTHKRCPIRCILSCHCVFCNPNCNECDPDLLKLQKDGAQGHLPSDCLSLTRSPRRFDVTVPQPPCLRCVPSVTRGYETTWRTRYSSGSSWQGHATIQNAHTLTQHTRKQHRQGECRDQCRRPSHRVHRCLLPKRSRV